MKRSTTWLIAAAFGLLFTGVAFSAMRYNDARDRANRAQLQNHEVQQLASQIQGLADQAAVAVTHSGQTQQLSGLVESAATECGIDRKKIVSISAQDARRVGKTPYYRLPTRITIEGVEMPRLAELLGQLAQGELLRIEDCRFVAPHGEVVGATWNAEFTVAYLIYEPSQDND